MKAKWPTLNRMNNFRFVPDEMIYLNRAIFLHKHPNTFALFFSPFISFDLSKEFICNGAAKITMNVFAVCAMKSNDIWKIAVGHSNESPIGLWQSAAASIVTMERIDARHSCTTTCCFLLNICRQFAIILISECMRSIRLVDSMRINVRNVLSEFDGFHIFAVIWPGLDGRPL